MTPEALAALHARCFSVPRPWGATEFQELSTMSGVFLLGCAGGFLMGRVVADEAELLTLAVAPENRRRGLGSRLVAGFATRAHDLGARRAFLEVAADNEGAKALYTAYGWREAGRRRNYYAPGLDAIVMQVSLSE